ncbi:MAG: cob(I)yrinic acid a,c-diamide adenosyltransferase [Candidatus Cloacimonetes bacterium]|nr:cob(I)yrinic acid a,c-diamide adenosyltransferase [Candidatus Cloacimonadota bacterium]
MSITTKGGDKGQTSLYTGERVWKDDLRVEAYGSLDELDALIGETKHHIGNNTIVELLSGIQNMLYRLMGQLATKDASYPYPICTKDVEQITDTIHSYEAKLNLKGFVIPGSSIPSAKLDICRTVARRAERRIIAFSHETELAPELQEYVNRLSDLFFILARNVEDELGVLTSKTKPVGGC